eukprot:CAMPEP_0176147786 /NCGR_PEP_ID=MMETSP0120_2-20121206/75343_1 /TAXON_ID=160619 /ORGANISM="Kryptoperidinium foliaceum, Strain CCMP 1326" /LENGTH=52 /DNA_ID=CAMNT_0017484419 /DNA_START=32 /DNA_END=186 /DNA_ORIENTATION=-
MGLRNIAVHADPADHSDRRRGPGALEQVGVQDAGASELVMGDGEVAAFRWGV